MSHIVKREGLLFVLSGPSGIGKTTVAQQLLKTVPSLTLSISVTTRPRRSSEIEGKDYYFVDAPTFERMVLSHQFLEYTNTFGRYSYGTPRHFVEQVLSAGGDVMFVIDWKGNRQIKEKKPESLVNIFLLPPSIETLLQRIHLRSQDDPETIALRMAFAAEDIQHWKEYDYALIHDDIDESVTNIKSILGAERLKRGRLLGMKNFVCQLISQLHSFK